MSALKRIFILPYLIGLVVALAHAIYALSTTPQAIVWWSVVFSSGSMLAFFCYLGMAGVASTSHNLPVQLFALSAATIMALIDFHWLPSLYTLLLGVCGSLLYIFWYSRLSREPSTLLSPGSTLPEFEFLDIEGNVVNNRRFLGKRVIYIFYRGSWCPLCVAQVKAVCEQYRILNTMGVEIVLISPQSQDDTRKLANKFSVPLVFGFDKGQQAAKRLGIVHENGVPPGLGGEDGGNTVLPTVIIVDEAGHVLWTHQTDNYRVRPEPETFLAVLGAQSADSSN